jgi:hypothetical protein
MASMALTVPLLMLALASPPGTHGAGTTPLPRASLIGLPGSAQGMLSGRPPFNLLVSVRRDDHGRTSPAGVGRRGTIPAASALRALARRAVGATSSHPGLAPVAEPRAPPAR